MLILVMRTPTGLSSASNVQKKRSILIFILDGARIVSSREFCSETFRLNDRTKNDLGAVMHVT